MWPDRLQNILQKLIDINTKIPFLVKQLFGHYSAKFDSVDIESLWFNSFQNLIPACNKTGRNRLIFSHISLHIIIEPSKTENNFGQ